MSSRFTVFAPVFAAVAGALGLAAVTVAAPAAAQSPITIELNKVEQLDAACRAYLLFENGQDTGFEEFRLDLVLFDAEGVIARRIAVEAAPLRANRSVVKLFDLNDLRCETVERVLLNDIAPCADGSGARQDCVDVVSLRSRTDIEFFQ